MKKLLVLFACSLCVGAFANDQYFSRNDILMTEHGIFVVQEGQLTQTGSVTYLGDGVYCSNQEYYGSCGRCGWALDKKGKCRNKTCNGYGPDRD